MNLPMLDTTTDGPLLLENIPALQEEVRELARERGAVIIAHNYQLPEIHPEPAAAESADAHARIPNTRSPPRLGPRWPYGPTASRPPHEPDW